MNTKFWFYKETHQLKIDCKMKNILVSIFVIIACMAAITLVSADSYCQTYIARELRLICAKGKMH